MSWNDIVAIEDASEARRAIDAVVSGLGRPCETVEYIGAARARELCPDGAWEKEVPRKILDVWRGRVGKVAFLRWEGVARRRLLETCLREAAEELGRRAEDLGVRLGRSPLDALIDYVETRRTT